MGNRQFTNQATSILAGTITNTSTVVQLSTGQGALFPNPTGTQYFIATIQDTSGNIEYVKCTARSGDNLTVVRAQEGSTALGFTANLARVELRDTAGSMAAFYQKDGDTLTGPMNLGAQTLTNGTLGAGIFLEGCTEIANTPIRGATGVTLNQIVVPTNGARATAGGQNILCVGDSLPVFTIGMIVMWDAAATNIPTGWYICDGSTASTGYVTPDLRNYFILGAGNSYALGATGSLSISTTSVSAGTPAISPVTLTVANLPVHAHPFDYFFGNSTNVIGIPGYAAPAAYMTGGGGSGTRNSFAGTPTGSGTSFTPSAATMAGHQHTVSVGPYYALYYIVYVGT